jgi:hypothetical protein
VDKVERYLEQAEFFRAVAKQARRLGTRTSLEYVARSYEVLAQSEKHLQRAARAQQALRQLYRPLASPDSQASNSPPREGEED